MLVPDFRSLSCRLPLRCGGTAGAERKQYEARSELQFSSGGPVEKYFLSFNRTVPTIINSICSLFVGQRTFLTLKSATVRVCSRTNCSQRSRSKFEQVPILSKKLRFACALQIDRTFVQKQKYRYIVGIRYKSVQTINQIKH